MGGGLYQDNFNNAFQLAPVTPRPTSTNKSFIGSVGGARFDWQTFEAAGLSPAYNLSVLCRNTAIVLTVSPH